MMPSHLSKTVSAAVAILIASAGVSAGPDGRSLRRTPVVEVFEQNRDSVVNISATGRVKLQGREYFDLFWMPQLEQKVHSIGSGFVMHESGYIVTNAHVVDQAIDLRVTFANGDEYDARHVVSDAAHDLAILKIEPNHPLKPISMGRSDDLMTGEDVVAIGNPLGYANTVTTGIISALHRRIEYSADTNYENLIQTDASINPGSSGGPLLNILGELIGVNTAIRAGAENIGFAIPVNQLRSLLPDMLNNAVTTKQQFQLGMRVEGLESPRVVEVDGDSPADKAGVRVGDQVLGVQDHLIGRDIDFYIAMLGGSAGDEVTMALDRDGTRREATLVLTEIPKPDGVVLARQKFGISVEPLTAKAGRLFGVGRNAGALVMDVDSRGAADRAGIRRGDLLVKIGRYRISTPEDLGPLLEGVGTDTPADLTVWRIMRGDVYEISKIRIYAR